MPRRRKALLLLALGLFVCGLIVVLTREKEPSYKGRSLSEWVAIHRENAEYAINPSPARREEATDAIRHIGSKALPCLLSWIDHEPMLWRNRLVILAQKLPGWLRKSWPIKPLLDEQPEWRSYDTLAAFRILGALAAPAVPDLIRRVKEADSQYKAGQAMRAMAYIGPEAAPALISILSSPEQESNSSWMGCIMIMETNARPLVPLVVQRLQGTDDQIAFQSAAVMQKLDPDPSLAVPALTKALNDPRAIVQFRAAETLGEFGKVARPALPALTNALSDPNPSVRVNASNAIVRITTALSTNTPPR